MAEERISNVEHPGSDIIMDMDDITPAPADAPIEAPAAMRPDVHNATTCTKCDRLRERDGEPVGRQCDICNGTGTDYIGRSCRHAGGQ